VFSVKEIVKATGGVLIQGDLKDKVCGISTDSRKSRLGDGFVALKGNNFDGHDFIAESVKSKASALVIQRDLKDIVPKEIAVIKVKDTTLALGDIARYQRQKFNLPVVAVTGSNGKTTTKEMIAWVLSLGGKVLKNEGTKNNQIGLPQTLIKLTQQDKFAVVEIGTNHFGEIDYLAKIARPNIGLITNIGLSHLEFLNNLRGVLKEKSSLLDSLSKPALAILNGDDKLLKEIITTVHRKMRVFSYGIHEKSDLCACAIKLKNGRLEFRVNGKFDFALSTLGYYNTYNALGAIAVGRLFGLTYPEISLRLAEFKFPQGRLNLIEFRGLKFIDDTYNSNPLSLKAALLALETVKCRGRKILVMGDMLELGKQKELLHRQAARSITNTCQTLLAVGRLSWLTAQAVENSGFKKKNIFYCDSSLEAKDLLFNKISPKPCDIILVKGSRSMKMEEIFRI
jgi:UDP-N-acetylmuramoyl-tripeptide--D-alanyl-D-alanine ligase